MKRGNRIAVLVLVVCIHWLLPKQAIGQKTFELRNYAQWDEQIYNLSGSEIYLRVNDRIFFIPKIAPFEFRTTKILDSLIANNDTIKNVFVLIRNCKYNFLISITIDVYRKYNGFGIYVYDKNSTNNYRVNLFETDSYGFSSPRFEITPNQEWNAKYYKPDKKPCCPDKPNE